MCLAYIYARLSLPIHEKMLFKGPLSGCLRQFLATESSLKMMKNAFYFTSKALFVLKIFKVNFKFYDVTAWLTNICNTHIAQYLEK